MLLLKVIMEMVVGFNKFGYKGKKRFIIICVGIIIIAFFLARYFSKKEAKELSENGRITEAIIINKKIIRGTSYVEFEFSDGLQLYRSTSANYGGYLVGDTVILLYSINDPQVNKLLRKK